MKKLAVLSILFLIAVAPMVSATGFYRHGGRIIRYNVASYYSKGGTLNWFSGFDVHHEKVYDCSLQDRRKLP